MCGIAGLISPNPERRIRAMLDAIEHRGRDDEGVFVSESFGGENLKTCFGHRRLSIIDTSPAGHQPFFSENGRFVLTYNGEIYNYLEIKKELEAKGYKFKTNCDTEVLINAFAEWNTDCLQKLNGMFAFAVWDLREKTLTLARDRAGIKPLYYAKIGKQIIFASEIKAILASGLIKPELDLEGLNQFLTFLWTVAPHTLFKNIFQLLPAHFLVWKSGEIKIDEWWDLNFDAEEKNGDENFWRERVLDAIDKAVRMEMVSDVPLGAFLSGGVD
ncbi:MAG: asparagine synthase (glutamine-hydrolyzing), partial [Pyrinomonadaceae bacterium]